MPVMESVTLENFRCFRERQTVRLAPLTLLVGENSTGKTSFLALIRALAATTFEARPVNFSTPPYDLGSFKEIAHNRGGASVAESFTAGFKFEVVDLTAWLQTDVRQQVPVELEFTFRERVRGFAPVLARQRITGDASWVEEETDPGQAEYRTHVGTRRGNWQFRPTDETPITGGFGDLARYLAVRGGMARFGTVEREMLEFSPLDGSPAFGEDDLNALLPIERFGALLLRQFRRADVPWEPYSIGPMRTRPRRTYDFEQWERSADGNHIPVRLAELSAFQEKSWLDLKANIERFGKASGLFDAIDIRHFGAGSEGPFQVQIGRDGGDVDAPRRNLVDVGYGVSQVVPIVAEMLLPSSPTDIFLLQQPEVHLHPSAQAALGTLFCEVATEGRQIIVETHSDHLIDRVRMDVRDGRSDLKAEDVLILYFERNGLDVKIHEIWWDQHGNLENVPDGYRRFFMEEVDRSIWGPQ